MCICNVIRKKNTKWEGTWKEAQNVLDFLDKSKNKQLNYTKLLIGLAGQIVFE